MTWQVDVGDCARLVAAMPACSVDAVVCDPPYGLEFMGKEWDRLWRDGEQGQQGRIDGHGGMDTWGSRPQYAGGRAAQEWHHRWAVEALRVLKPGGHLLAFGGTRTSHRLACALEDAGFEIRDTIVWLYGSGFPKSLDVGKAIDKAAGSEREVVGPPRGIGGRDPNNHVPHENYAGLTGRWAANETAPSTPDAERWDGWGTALKPAHEPIVVARKPLAGTVAANVLEHGTGALNIDGGRIDAQGDDLARMNKEGANGWKNSSGGPNSAALGGAAAAGRWPPNVALDQGAAEQLDRQSGELHSQDPATRGVPGKTTGVTNFAPSARGQWYPDSGGASRFFYIAKASRAERNAGLDGFEEQSPWTSFDGQYAEGRNPQTGKRTGPYKRQQGNHHPTVKPVNLMRWLVRLVTPPDGLILDPFCGSGTTGVAAVLEGFNFIGCEQDAAYADIARARVGWWEQHGHDALRIVAEQEAAENEREAVRAAGQLELL